MKSTKELKRRYNRAQRTYGQLYRLVMTTTQKDATGNLVISPTFVRNLVSARAEVSKAYHRYDGARQKENSTRRCSKCSERGTYILKFEGFPCDCLEKQKKITAKRLARHEQVLKYFFGGYVLDQNMCDWFGERGVTAEVITQCPDAHWLLKMVYLRRRVLDCCYEETFRAAFWPYSGCKLPSIDPPASTVREAFATELAQMVEDWRARKQKDVCICKRCGIPHWRVRA